MAKHPTISLPTHLKERLAQGHPWVYRNHVPDGMRLPNGAWARLRCGNWQGWGLWDAGGPIALRVFEAAEPPDARWLRAQVAAAWELRAPLRARGDTAYRWLFGEGDGLPGLTVDRYGAYAVVQTLSAGVETLLPWLEAALRACDPTLRGVLTRRRVGGEGDEQLVAASGRDEADDAPAPTRASRVELLWGQAPDDLVVLEHGLRFRVDLGVGQKTGLFLDHRENRRFVEGLSQGRSVLNCFAYTGAFGIYALRGGATHVVNADIGRGLAQAAAENLALNKLEAARHEFVTADCFALLEDYVRQGRRFDLVILDPPSFARSKQNRFAALRAYTRLNALGMRCVAPGGLLASASCTSQVGPDAFREVLAAAGASSQRRCQIIHEAGQPLDHPVPAGFPEGRYLKFVVGRVR
jgi:23S rRNA (cytosine1962-C5)-methyltransferase